MTENRLQIPKNYKKLQSSKNWHTLQSTLTVLILESMIYLCSLVKFYFYEKKLSACFCFLNPIAYHLMCHGPVCSSWPVLPDLYLNIIARTTTKTDRHKHLETGKECCMVWHSTDEIPADTTSTYQKHWDFSKFPFRLEKIFLIENNYSSKGQ